MSRKRDKVEILLYLITGAFFGFLLSVFAKLPYDANILVAIATLTLVIITLWYAYSTHKLVKQPIDLLLINEIYSPLNTIMISQKRLINRYEEANLRSIQNIRKKVWYYSVNESISKSIEEWKDQVEKYEEIRRRLIKEVQIKVEDCNVHLIVSSPSQATSLYSNPAEYRGIFLLRSLDLDQSLKVPQ